ncbi:MAG TPA: hypothetical protein VKB09_10265 [Thermomicrobiales bacterium]|nr:hypothetical protein [Thermomicrobiales bacterium]
MTQPKLQQDSFFLQTRPQTPQFALASSPKTQIPSQQRAVLIAQQS